ncbi:UDP-3-O-acyl-N-acetylglucosamine deacetylase [Streptomyces sp. NPDC102365]|uniref:UDP-3-O-acyl-N-acetylglucosamine deacetylase n=1 Tax=Streptomyces sp. NPDC102365 TaxID=3366162 RepID=UPI003820EF70
MTDRRATVRAPVLLDGVGLHSGLPVTVTIAPGDDGIAFTRTTGVRAGTVRVPARVAHVTATDRRTRLGPVSTVEHLMSALAGARVTDAEIHLAGEEVPGCDGSARPFTDALHAVGLRDLGPWRPPRLPRPVRYAHGDTVLRARPGTGLWSVTYDRAPRFPGRQTVTARLPADYADLVAPARTLVLETELARARAHGLGRGLDEPSVVVIGDDAYVGRTRFADEPARHKLLDLIGDLYLTGIPLHHLDVTAVRPGHHANIALAALVTEAAAGCRRGRSVGQSGSVPRAFGVDRSGIRRPP